jgi:hypothetical protein
VPRLMSSPHYLPRGHATDGTPGARGQRDGAGGGPLVPEQQDLPIDRTNSRHAGLVGALAAIGMFYFPPSGKRAGHSGLQADGESALPAGCGCVLAALWL